MGHAYGKTNSEGLGNYRAVIEKLENEGYMNSSYGGASMSRHGMNDTDGSPYTVMVSENIWNTHLDTKARKVVVIGADGEASSAFDAHGPYLRMVPNNFDAFKRAVEEIKVYRVMMGASA